MSTRPWKSGICWSASSDIWNFRLLTSSLCFFISAANFRCSPNFIHPWHLLAIIFSDMSVKFLYASTRFTSFNFKSRKEHFKVSSSRWILKTDAYDNFLKYDNSYKMYNQLACGNLQVCINGLITRKLYSSYKNLKMYRKNMHIFHAHYRLDQ